MGTISITQKLSWNLLAGIVGSIFIFWLWPDYKEWSWQVFSFQAVLIFLGYSLYGWDFSNITVHWPRWMKWIKNYMIGVPAGIILFLVFWEYVVPQILSYIFT